MIHYKYTTYVEAESNYILIRRVPSKLTSRIKVTRIRFKNKNDAIEELQKIKLKLQTNNLLVINQDETSFRVKHQSPLLTGLRIKDMNISVSAKA